MPEFRTASGLVSCASMVRTTAGLVAASPQFFGATGSIDTGGGATATADFSAGAETSQKLQTKGTSINRRVLDAQAGGGMAPYRFLFEIVSETAPGQATIGNEDREMATLSTTTVDADLVNIDTVTIRLTVTDAANRTAMVTRDVTIRSN